MAVWDDILSEHDRRCLANRPRIGQRPELGNNPALLVIDMQRGVIGEDRPIYEQQDKYPSACGTFAWEAIRHLEKLIPAAREAGIPVMYSRFVIRPETGITIPPGSSFGADNPYSEIIEEIAPLEGDIYIEKNRPSIFFHTPALYVLFEKKVDTLLIAGNTTSGCIRASAIDGAGYNFRVAVIEECTFDRLEFTHKASLFDLWYKYCELLSVREIYEYIKKIHRNRQ
jgi:nicotinamidase-related amidase